MRAHWSKRNVKITPKSVVRPVKEPCIRATRERNAEVKTADRPIVEPFRLVRSTIFDAGLSGGASSYMTDLAEILQESSPVELWLFSFQFDFDLFMPMIPKRCSVHVVGQLNTMISERQLESYANLTVHPVTLPRQWGCHHSKLIFCFFADGTFRLHVPSFNLSSKEINLVQQMTWSSPVLVRGGKTAADHLSPSQSQFKANLLQYLLAYPSQLLKDLVSKLAAYCFDPLDRQNCQFVYSTPYGGGLAMLKRCLKNDIDADSDSFPNLFIQVSSIGNPFRKKYDLLHDVFVPYLYTDWFKGSDLKSKDYRTPYVANTSILWPTSHEMGHCLTRGLSRGWFFYKRMPKSTEMIQPCFRKHGPAAGVAAGSASGKSVQNRHCIPSHTKYYVQFSDADTMRHPDWVLFTSHNLSQSAWGPTPLSNPMSYECGILYSKKNTRTVHLELDSIQPYAYPGAFRAIGAATTSTAACALTVRIFTPYPLHFQRYADTDVPHSADSDR